jgi:hypothetical protein
LADYAQDLFKPEEAVAGYFRPQKKQDPPFWMMKRGRGMAPRQKWFYERWFGW